jgi:acyl-CoA reductase-like NAD-dependent aldehyde dehydrogenase
MGITTNAVAGVDDRDQICVGGRWQEASGDTLLPVVNPYTEQTVARLREASETDVDRVVTVARDAFDSGAWSTMSALRRSAVLHAIADELEAREAVMARVITTENGMPVTASTASVRRAVATFRYFADIATTYGFRVDRPRADGATTRVLREPSGVVAAITPWNGPLGTASLKLGAALAAGCTVVLKTAPETPLSGYLLADIVADLVEAGTLPAGVVSVFTSGRAASEALVAHRGVDRISFTGSTLVGGQIMAAAAGRIARVTLELGGKSAAIVLDDAPLETVLPTLVMGGCGNAGQMCFALTRVLVSERRADEITAAVANAMCALTLGDPMDPATQVGPLTTSRQRERVESYLAVGREEGARVITGGGRPTGQPHGFFVQPTLFGDVSRSMRIAQEEIFGPVIGILTYRDVDDAVAIANDSAYGLAGSVYTADVEVGFEIASRIRTGTCSVNGAVFDTTTPFGGYKQSGLGREGGPEGIEDFTELKAVHMPA